MYKKHCDNLRALQTAIDLVQRDLRKYISMELKENEYVYTKLFSYLITCWTEVRILKVLYEPNAFTDFEIAQVISSSTLENKWKTALAISFCKAYKVKFSNDFGIIESKLPPSKGLVFKVLMDLIENDLAQSIELRNRIAHGQWKFAFTSNLKEYSQPITTNLRRDNIVNLQINKDLLTSLASIINDLAVSPPTFERDFDKNYTKLLQQKLNLHKRNYKKYKQNMISKYKRGLTKRNL